MAFTSTLESTVAVIWLEVMLRTGKEVCVGPRLKRTCEAWVGSVDARKLEPFTVRVKEAAPAAAEVGVIEVTVGTGLAAGLMRKLTTFERPLVPVPECGLRVWTKAVPGLAMRSAETVAVSVLALTTVVGMVLPFHWTTDLATYPLPVLSEVPDTVSVNPAPPALACEGAMKEV